MYSNQVIIKFYFMEFLINNANDAKMVNIINANPTIIAETNTLPKLLTHASGREWPTLILGISCGFIDNLLSNMVNFNTFL